MLNFRNRILPPVVKNLLIINGLMYLATVVLTDSLNINMVKIFGLSYFTSDNFRFWQLFTHIFMHGSFMHLFSNMFALWMFGAIIENYLGSKRFLSYYILTGIGAAIIHMFVLHYEMSAQNRVFDNFFEKPTPEYFEKVLYKYKDSAPPDQFQVFTKEFFKSPDDPLLVQQAVEIVNKYKATFVHTDIVTVGASGAVFGVLLAFGMLFPNTLILIWFIFPLRAKYLVILYGLFELYSGAANHPGDNIAHFAHLGGMLIGYILLKAWKIRRPYNF